MSLRETFSKLIRRASGLSALFAKEAGPGAVAGTPEDIEQQSPVPGVTLLMAAARTDGPVFDTLLAAEKDIHATGADGENATMIAIRHSALNNATALMKRGGVVDFGDPSIATQLTVANYEGNFDFLLALETRRKEQEAVAMMKQASEKTAAEKARRSQISEVVATVAGGADSVAAPNTARFRKRATPQA